MQRPKISPDGVQAMNAEAAVSVTVPARLHLGFIDLEGGLGRRFGSVGLAVSGLDAVVEAKAARQSGVEGDPSGRARELLDLAAQQLGLSRGTRLRVRAAPPRHAGLGSGTQLALAVGAAVAAAHGRPFDPRAMAPQLGRGARSGVGVAVFEQGGFIVDGGRGARPQVAPVLARYFFPSEWRVVLIHDSAHEGLHGQAERAAFAQLPAMSAQAAGELARLCLVGLMPAVIEQDFAVFAAVIDELQQRIGAYFAPCQGGAAYTSTAVGGLMASLRDRLGLRATGQSSWGPTGFIFVPDEALARRVLSEINRYAPSGGRLRGQIVTGCNHGAIIEGRA